MHPPDYIYIEPTNLEIREYREIIKKQGNKTCNCEISIENINALTFTFGFLVYLKCEQISENLLLSIILCTYTSNAPDQVFIELVCSADKTGKILIELTEEKARSMDIKRIYVYALDKDNLVNWYISMGYSIINKNTNLSLMVKYL